MSGNWYSGLYQRITDDTQRYILEGKDLALHYADLLRNYDNIEIISDKNVPDERKFNYAKIDELYNRVRSDMIKIAVCGAFSSGKSFLISGLLNHLQYAPKPSELNPAEIDDDWVVLLPVAAEHTTNCTVKIFALPEGNETPYLKLRFKESDKWHRVTDENATIEDVRIELLKYVTTIKEHRELRDLMFRNYSTVEAHVYLNNMEFPAIIYDLPGLGGINTDGRQEEYDKIFKKRVNEADCIIYVTSAIRELTNRELDLLRELENSIHRNPLQHTFFIVSQIDRAPRDYQRIVDINKNYLMKNFETDGVPNERFIGDNFIPVSPAQESKTHYRLEHDEIKQEHADIAINKSGMPDLRDRLRNYLWRISGPKHQKEILEEYIEFLSALYEDANAPITAYSEPIEDGEKKLAEIQQEREFLKQQRQDMETILDSTYAPHIAEVFGEDFSSQLADYLEHKLEAVLTKKDVTKPEVRNELLRSQRRYAEDWFMVENGLHDKMQRAIEEYDADMSYQFDKMVKKHEEKYNVQFWKVISNFQSANSIVTGSDSKAIADHAVNVAALLFGGGGGLTGLSAWGLLGTTALPIAISLAVVLTGVSIFQRGRRLEQIELAREEFRQEIRKYATEFINASRKQLENTLAKEYKGIWMKTLNNYITNNRNEAQTLKNRMKSGDLSINKERVEAFEHTQAKLQRQIENIMRQIALIDEVLP